MRTIKQLLFIFSFLLSASFAFSQAVTWELHQGQGAGIFTPGPDDPPVNEILNELTGGRQAIHGDPGGFQYADIPDANDAGWEAAPIDEDGDLCWRLDRSRLTTSFTSLDFTYFQTSVFVTDASAPFILRFYQVDDGARAYVFNSRTLQDPENAFIEGGDARLFAPLAETDISPLFVEGEENRIVIVQFDDSQTANYLKVEVVGGEGIDEGDDCENDTEAPQILVQADNGGLLTVDDFFQDNYQCGQPTTNFVYLDNCIPTDSLEIIISSNLGFDSATGASIISGFVSATDAVGNETREVFEYRVLDTEAPTIVSTIGTIDDTLNVCGEYALSIDNLGVEVIDNCGGEVTLSLSDTLVTGDVSTVTITATDATGNSSTTQVELNLADNPATLIVTAEDDTFEAAIGSSITFSAADLISNDMASDASGLEVQEVTLIDEMHGTLVDNGDDTYTFTPTDGFVDDVALTYIVKSEDGSLFFEGNGNFYEYVENGTPITWTDASQEAETRTLNGVNGYLATITSVEENAFITSKLQGLGWIGASDAAVEGDWRWVTGPEGQMDSGQGMLFWIGEGDGIAVNGAYNNWSTLFGAEPNNDPIPFVAEGEDYGHMYNDAQRAGEWNDFQNDKDEVTGYVVEYGGVDGCDPEFAATGNITISFTESATECENDTEAPQILGLETIVFDTLDIDCPTDAPAPAGISVIDNCDNAPSLEIERDFIVVNDTFPPREDFDRERIIRRGTQVNYTFTATDASENTTISDVVVAYFIPIETESPQITLTVPDLIEDEVNLCNSYDLNLDNIIESITDNCGLEGEPTIAIQKNGFSANTIEGEGDYFIIIRAKDVNANIGSAEFNLILTANPDAAIVTVVGDTLTVAPDDALTFTTDELLANDNYTGDFSELIVEEVQLTQDPRAPSNQGTVVDNGDGSYTFTPDFNGIAQGFAELIYTAAATFSPDGDCTPRSEGTILINITEEEVERPFITTWEVTAESPSVTIYGSTAFNYNYTIDWGDGTIEDNQTESAIHTYSTPGRYDISISGVFPVFSAGLGGTDTENAAKLVTVKQWGDIEWQSMTGTFASAINLVEFEATDIPDLSRVASLSQMFFNATQFNGSISDWDVSTVTNMESIFFGASSFNQPIGNWEVSNVITMESMFREASSFNQAIGAWDVSNVTNMVSMFRQASVFDQPISSWSTSNVTNMSSMFNNALSFDQPLNDWDVSSVSFMISTFRDASSFNQLLSNWDVSSVERMASLFNSASSFNQSLGNWNLQSLLSGSGTEFIGGVNMLDNSGMNQANYDATLNGWAAQATNSSNGIVIGAEGLTYSCTGKEGRDVLMNQLGWTFNGDIQEGECFGGSIVDNRSKIAEFSMEVNPNPFHTQANLQMNLLQEEMVNIDIRDVSGRTVKSIALVGHAGENTFSIQRDGLATGIYFISVRTASTQQTLKVVMTQ